MAYGALLTSLEEWHVANSGALTSRGLKPAFHRSGSESPGDKPVARLDLDNASHFGSLLLWDTGEAELNVIDLSGQELLVEHRSITDRDALQRAVAMVVAVVENGAAHLSDR